MALNILLIRESYDTVDGDAAAALLMGRGDTVIADNDAGNHDVSQFDVIVLADPGTLTLAQVGTTPVVTLGEDYVELGHCASMSTGTSSDIEVLNDEHPIAVAAGLTAGALTIATSAGALSRADPGTLGAGAVAIAQATTSTTGRIVLYAFEQGAALASGDPAPARHVGFGYESAGNLNATGQAILFACVDWAADALGGDPATPITGTASGTSSDSATAVLTLSATATDAGTSSDSATATLAQSIMGAVTASGSPVQGATIYLIDQATDSVIATETTAVDGTYEFTSVSPGTYHVVAEAEGYAAPSRSFVVIE